RFLAHAGRRHLVLGRLAAAGLVASGVVGTAALGLVDRAAATAQPNCGARREPLAARPTGSVDAAAPPLRSDLLGRLLLLVGHVLLAHAAALGRRVWLVGVGVVHRHLLSRLYRRGATAQALLGRARSYCRRGGVDRLRVRPRPCARRVHDGQPWAYAVPMAARDPSG